MALSEREEQILRNLEQQLDGPSRWSEPTPGWKLLSVVSMAFVAGFAAAFLVIVSVLMGFVAFLIFILAASIAGWHTDWDGVRARLDDGISRVATGTDSER